MIFPTRSGRTSSGDLLHAVRKLLRLTLADLQAKSGVHASTISRIERGQRHLSLPIAARLLRALDQSDDRPKAGR